MQENDKQDDHFPKGFEHVQDRLNETTQRVKAIDKQIESLPKDRGLALEYRPPNFVGRKPFLQQRTIDTLKDQQHQLKADTLAKTEADTRGAETKDGRVVGDQVREKLFPNPYRGMSQEELRADKDTPKEIEQSQDYMDAKLVAAAAARKAAPQRENATPIKKETADMSMSARFSLSLGYTKASEKTPAASPSQLPNRQKDIDRD